MNVSSLFRSCRRFKVDGDAPDMAAIEAGLTTFAFEPSVVVSRAPQVGWTRYDRPLSPSTFPVDINAWSHNQYVLASMRVDQRRVSASLLRARVDEAARAWCTENERDRVPHVVRSELRERLEADLLRETPPTMRLYPFLWCAQDGWIAFAGRSDSVVDAFRKLFHRSFGLAIEEQPVGAGEDASSGELLFADPASDWLTWLMWRGGEGGKLKLGEGEEADFWIDGSVKLEGLRATEVNPGVLAHLAGGGPPEALVLALKRGDREYIVKLSGLDVGGVKLPALTRSGDLAEQVYEAAFLYEDAWYVLARLHDEFSQERARSGEQQQAAVRRWIGAGLDPVAAFLERLRAQP